VVHSVIVNHEGKRYQCTFVVNVNHLANSKAVRKAFTRAIVGQKSYVHACSRGVQIIEVQPINDP